MKDNGKSYIIFYLLGGIAVIWLSLMITPYISGGLSEVLQALPKITENPLKIVYCNSTIKTIGIFLGIYILAIIVFQSSKKNYRRGKEYGSAIWGIAKQVCKKYKQFPQKNNKILTQNFSIGLNSRKHRRNLNILVCGGSRSR